MQTTHYAWWIAGIVAGCFGLSLATEGADPQVADATPPRVAAPDLDAGSFRTTEPAPTTLDPEAMVRQIVQIRESLGGGPLDNSEFFSDPTFEIDIDVQEVVEQKASDEEQSEEGIIASLVAYMVGQTKPGDACCPTGCTAGECAKAKCCPIGCITGESVKAICCPAGYIAGECAKTTCCPAGCANVDCADKKCAGCKCSGAISTHTVFATDGCNKPTCAPCACPAGECGPGACFTIGGQVVCAPPMAAAYSVPAPAVSYPATSYPAYACMASAAGCACTANGGACVCSSQGPGSDVLVGRLRDAAMQLDQVAHELEQIEQYERADEIRAQASKLRRDARNIRQPYTAQATAAQATLVLPTPPQTAKANESNPPFIFGPIIRKAAVEKNWEQVSPRIILQGDVEEKLGIENF
jgi:hypothetical protein